MKMCPITISNPTAPNKAPVEEIPLFTRGDFEPDSGSLLVPLLGNMGSRDQPKPKPRLCRSGGGAVDNPVGLDERLRG
ncbi:MAG: hypothetical protein RLZZ490_2594 [Cyanobacteriota bacterium]|jgi:hypothetical protein